MLHRGGIIIPHAPLLHVYSHQEYTTITIFSFRLPSLCCLRLPLPLSLRPLALHCHRLYYLPNSTSGCGLHHSQPTRPRRSEIGVGRFNHESWAWEPGETTR
ncbi:hypothetical protein CRG98_009616 [Punica granatum]|uniref:Uncharacterized protein n=1 Tax=Punica granatum TaxID=22663 RepID=A0A2I0KNZ8_PUNGR|nr:hypothetical protein CRG98_009616 [Punica granatum]